jgi:hypothetical protein
VQCVGLAGRSNSSSSRSRFRVQPVVVVVCVVVDVDACVGHRPGPDLSEKRAVMSLLSQKKYMRTIGSTVYFGGADVGSGWSSAGAEEMRPIFRLCTFDGAQGVPRRTKGSAVVAGAECRTFGHEDS